MKIRNLITATVIAAAILAIPAFAGQWQFDGPENWKWTYIEDSGSKVAEGWKQIDGAWYYFDSNGYIDTGIRKFADDGKFYYMEASDPSRIGQMRTDITSAYYTFNEDGSIRPYYPRHSTESYNIAELIDYDNNGGETSKGIVPDAWYQDLFNRIDSKFNAEWSNSFTVDCGDEYKSNGGVPVMNALIEGVVAATDYGYQWTYDTDTKKLKVDITF